MKKDVAVLVLKCHQSLLKQFDSENLLTFPILGMCGGECLLLLRLETDLVPGAMPEFYIHNLINCLKILSEYG